MMASVLAIRGPDPGNRYNPLMPAGYSGTPLVKKLGIKSGMRVAFVNAPKNLEKLLGPLPEDVRQLARVGKDMDYVHVFCATSAGLEQRLPRLVQALAPDGMLWISWPKKTSALAKDLDGAGVRESGLATGLVDIKVCAVDEDWSGHKFVRRRKDR